jgi:hypothetical protein
MDMSADPLDLVAGIVETMAFLTPLGPSQGPPPQALHIQVAAHGPRSGVVHLAADSSVATAMARNLLALEPDAPVADDDAREALRELANVLAGNLLPQVWGEGEWRLDPPEPGAWPATPDTAVHLALAEGALSLCLCSNNSQGT